MSSHTAMPSVAVICDDAAWCSPVVEGLKQAGATVTVIDVTTRSHAELSAIVASAPTQFDVIFNRLSARPAPASGLTMAGTITQGTALMQEVALVARGPSSRLRRVLNDATCHEIGSSKALQDAVLRVANVRTPPTVPVYSAKQAIAAAKKMLDESQTDGLEDAVLVKPNVGGRGAAITKLTKEQLNDEAAAIALLPESLLEADSCAVVQQAVLPENPEVSMPVHKVEVCGGQVLYEAVVSHPKGGDKADFNNCLGDVCGRPKKKGPTILTIPATKVAPAIIEECRTIADNASMDLGSIEFVVDPAGRRWYVDINPVSTLMKGNDGDLASKAHTDYIVAVAKGQCGGKKQSASTSGLSPIAVAVTIAVAGLGIGLIAKRHVS